MASALAYVFFHLAVQVAVVPTARFADSSSCPSETALEDASSAFRNTDQEQTVLKACEDLAKELNEEYDLAFLDESKEQVIFEHLCTMSSDYLDEFTDKTFGVSWVNLASAALSYKRGVQDNLKDIAMKIIGDFKEMFYELVVKQARKMIAAENERDRELQHIDRTHVLSGNVSHITKALQAQARDRLTLTPVETLAFFFAENAKYADIGKTLCVAMMDHLLHRLISSLTEYRAVVSASSTSSTPESSMIQTNSTTPPLLSDRTLDEIAASVAEASGTRLPKSMLETGLQGVLKQMNTMVPTFIPEKWITLFDHIFVGDPSPEELSAAWKNALEGNVMHDLIEKLCGALPLDELIDMLTLTWRRQVRDRFWRCFCWIGWCQQPADGDPAEATDDTTYGQKSERIFLHAVVPTLMEKLLNVVITTIKQVFSTDLDPLERFKPLSF